MGKYIENAEKQIFKGELLYKAEQFKRAGKMFASAGENFLKADDYKEAIECFNKAAQSFDLENKIGPLLKALRNAGNASLSIAEYLDANKFFKKALNYISELKRSEIRDLNYILFSTLSYLCLFTEGKQDQGLTLLKQIKKNVNDTYFKENQLISLVKDLVIATRDKNKKYLDKVELVIDKYKLRKAELKLIKDVLVVANSHILMETKLSLDKDQYTTKDIINLTVSVDTSSLREISKNPVYNYKIKEIRIANIGLALSENITPQKKPKISIKLKPGEKHDFQYELKPHFQIDNPFIGPILLSCVIDEKFIFYLQEKEVLIPNLISPPPSLDISIEALRTPLIDKSFPLEILIENSSEGDALELELDIEFPEELKVIRGTIKKQIYSLNSNENMKWELSLKPLEAGDFNIKMDVTFKDPDGNVIEETKNFPFSIKL